MLNEHSICSDRIDPLLNNLSDDMMVSEIASVWGFGAMSVNTHNLLTQFILELKMKKWLNQFFIHIIKCN